MKIISWNVNGLRAVSKKGFLKWFEEVDADIVCLQEIKLQKHQLSNDLISPRNYYSCFNFAEKKGYAGVAVYSKVKPIIVEQKLGFPRFDHEGRVLRIDFPDFCLVNLYLPHGGREKEDLGYKLETYKYLLSFLEGIKNKNVVLAGDFNVAHKEIDLARPKQSKNNIGFTRQERKQLDNLIEIGFADSFRKYVKGSGCFTWWSYFYEARKRNIGWRLDYIFTSSSTTLSLKNAFILKDVFGSDHCPIGIEI